MTIPSDPEPLENIPPEILSEEDAPFDSEFECNDMRNQMEKPRDILLGQETPTKKGMDFEKFKLGSSILGWCLFLMTLCIFLSLWAPENELVSSGFEAFKLIVMTILGYLFGSNNQKPD